MATASRGTAKRSTAKRPAAKRRYWSREVTEHSDAMTLEEQVFKRSPKEIARSVKRSAEQSHRRKASPFQSAMSMLSFYGNRAGRNLPASRRRAIQEAKEELRKLYHRPSKAP
ncbi:DUF3175 domain-containing protein [Corallococcus exiguus]|uniref:DUF3175 domain-containing protein n=1 Tax=Corallococcus TaxID=83461 RepID=UPI000EA391E3|nr:MULTISPECIES: DUF3175 domain-containing protein [Corallococcus]NNC17865.1 DUF3175 domain-containing protein [Corallococcus exiguus]NRD55191.1 DUF3175 domain-containing protein [Corallococcus exiguus]NRD61546.1 DUF3175 domain-containing protein [Corallococcus exiguus]RKH23945.1 DUF3175 domain-containing protein [Corallococcus sp. CA041A]